MEGAGKPEKKPYNRGLFAHPPVTRPTHSGGPIFMKHPILMKRHVFSALPTILATAVLCTLFTTLPSFAEEGLRQCKNNNCRRHALSDSWGFCPYCGTRLPKSVVKKVAADTVVGNMFRSGEYGFQIEVPNEKWSFLVGEKLAEELNEDATVGLESKNDVYSMVIAEKMPSVSLDKYVNLVAPSLDNPRLVGQKKTNVKGGKAIRTKWSGTLNEVPFHFYQLLVAYGDTRLQVVSWLAAGNDSPENQAEIAAIEKSFKILQK